MRFIGRQGTLVDSAIKCKGARRALEASCTPVDGQVFNDVTHVRTSRPSKPGERAMDHVAVIENQQENPGAGPIDYIYRCVQSVRKTPDVRRTTPATRGGLQRWKLHDPDAMAVKCTLHIQSLHLGENSRRRQGRPVTGEEKIRFVDITLGEPAPSLFQPPADYNLIEESGPFVLRLKL